MDLQKALDNTNMLYNEIVEIADDIVHRYTTELDKYIEFAKNLETYSNESLRDLILKITLCSYTFSEIKEKSIIKMECAETLRKEAHAKIFNESEGTVTFRENKAIMESSNEIVVEAIYTLVASLLKTRLDEVHRIVDALKSVLMSRMQEAKLSSIE